MKTNLDKCSKCDEVNYAWDMTHNSEIDRIDAVETEFNKKWTWLCSPCFDEVVSKQYKKNRSK